MRASDLFIRGAGPIVPPGTQAFSPLVAGWHDAADTARTAPPTWRRVRWNCGRCFIYLALRLVARKYHFRRPLSRRVISSVLVNIRGATSLRRPYFYQEETSLAMQLVLIHLGAALTNHMLWTPGSVASALSSPRYHSQHGLSACSPQEARHG